MEDLHIIGVDQLTKINIMKGYATITRFSITNLEHEVNFKYEKNNINCYIKFLNPKGVVSINNELWDIPINFENLNFYL